jgi:hypothetical protein
MERSSDDERVNPYLNKTGIYINKKIAILSAILLSIIILACLLTVIYMFKPSTGCLTDTPEKYDLTSKNLNSKFEDIFCSNIKG